MATEKLSHKIASVDVTKGHRCNILLVLSRIEKGQSELNPKAKLKLLRRKPVLSLISITRNGN